MAKKKQSNKLDRTGTYTKKMADKELVSDILIPDSERVEFVCPECGKISQNDVIFLCNTCENSDLIYKDGIYMCPQCLYPGDNFECMKCENKHVRMKYRK